MKKVAIEFDGGLAVFDEHVNLARNEISGDLVSDSIRQFINMLVSEGVEIVVVSQRLVSLPGKLSIQHWMIDKGLLNSVTTPFIEFSATRPPGVPYISSNNYGTDVYECDPEIFKMNGFWVGLEHATSRNDALKSLTMTRAILDGLIEDLSADSSPAP